jgi:glycosyltransferase involved in cell wall biosynthesis
MKGLTFTRMKLRTSDQTQDILVHETTAPAKGTLRVLLIAPSLDIVGGHSVQANRLLAFFRKIPWLEVKFQPINARLPRPLESIRFLRTILRSLIYVPSVLRRAWGIDIFHVFTASFYSYNLWTLPALACAKLSGKKFVLHYHDGQADEHLKNWPTAVPSIRRMDKVVAPSGYLFEVFRKYGIDAQVIYNIIDSSQFHFRRRTKPRPVFLHNRALEPLYNVECTLRAFQLIQERYPEARLTLALDGISRPGLERLARELKLRNTEFVGSVPYARMPELYDAADIYLTNPNIDNMPVSVLECFASGLPLISTRVGGVPFIVEHERTGLLVNANDHQAIAQTAFRLLEEDGLAERLAQNALQECRKYREDAVGKQWLELYKDVLNGNQAS